MTFRSSKASTLQGISDEFDTLYKRRAQGEDITLKGDLV
jgi:hypothetical protein